MSQIETFKRQLTFVLYFYRTLLCFFLAVGINGINGINVGIQVGINVGINETELTKPNCTQPWQLINQSCYQFVKKNGKSGKGLTYNESVNECNSLGGKLFEPVDEATNDFVHKAAYPSLGKWIWIGVNDIDEEGRYIYLFFNF
jgi:hypothetical protein